MIKTILLAFGVLAAALLFMGIGWLLTGKNKIVRGACGMTPEECKDKEVECDICGKKDF